MDPPTHPRGPWVSGPPRRPPAGSVGAPRRVGHAWAWAPKRPSAQEVCCARPHQSPAPVPYLPCPCARRGAPPPPLLGGVGGAALVSCVRVRLPSHRRPAGVPIPPPGLGVPGLFRPVSHPAGVGRTAPGPGRPLVPAAGLPAPARWAGAPRLRLGGHQPPFLPDAPGEGPLGPRSACPPSHPRGLARATLARALAPSSSTLAHRARFVGAPCGRWRVPAPPSSALGGASGGSARCPKNGQEGLSQPTSGLGMGHDTGGHPAGAKRLGRAGTKFLPCSASAPHGQAQSSCPPPAGLLGTPPFGAGGDTAPPRAQARSARLRGPVPYAKGHIPSRPAGHSTDGGKPPAGPAPAPKKMLSPRYTIHERG